jgi:hypothetical protein
MLNFLMCEDHWIKQEIKEKIQLPLEGIFKMQRLARTREGNLQQEELLLKHHLRESQRNATILKRACLDSLE